MLFNKNWMLLYNIYSKWLVFSFTWEFMSISKMSIVVVETSCLFPNKFTSTQGTALGCV